MMAPKLVRLYEAGAITGYQVMIDCLHMLDPGNPDFVLSHLPEEILDEMLQYTQRYDPRGICSKSGVLPAVDQVDSARRWIETHRRTQIDVKETAGVLPMPDAMPTQGVS